MKAAIVANGEISASLSEEMASADVIVACDGAAKALSEMSVVPDYITGDMDSLDAGVYTEADGPVVIRSSCQQTNDLTKAFRFVLGMEPDEIVFYGIGGKREDHTLGNLSLLADYAWYLSGNDSCAESLFGGNPPENRPGHVPVLSAVSRYTRIIPLTDTCVFEAEKGQQLSIIPFDRNLSIRSEGLDYQTSDVVFDSLWKATLNRASGGRVLLEFSKPARVLLFMARQSL